MSNISKRIFFNCGKPTNVQHKEKKLKNKKPEEVWHRSHNISYTQILQTTKTRGRNNIVHLNKYSTSLLRYSIFPSISLNITERIFYIGSMMKRMINGVRSASIVAILLVAVTPCIAFQLSAPAPVCAQTCATSRGITVLAASADTSEITAADAAAALGEESLQKGSGAAFDNFDYNAHWYPVAFAQDVPFVKPTKVTLFDVDYVISRLPPKSKPKRKQIPGAKSDDEEVIYALLDRCAHKSASLSEGRVILPSCSKNSDADEESTAVRFQCAYHGWSYDGKSGKCLQIPQVLASEGVGNSSSTRSSSQGPASYGRRADTTAVPAMVQQGIIWLFPGGNLEKALLCPPPPRVPELDLPGYRMVPVVRDFPIDWAILLENILDPGEYTILWAGSCNFYVFFLIVNSFTLLLLN